MTITALRPRNCVLDEASHKYFWDPEGENIQMAISVTGVIAAGKPPVDYSKWPRGSAQGHARPPLHGSLGCRQDPAASCQP